MSDRVEQAVDEGRQCLKASSEVGEDALQSFICDQYDQMTPREFTELINEMSSAPENSSDDGSLSVWSEDSNGDGFLQVTEIWTQCQGSHEQLRSK